jgi:uncharacterized protein YjbI with pentapeptide repeats
MKGSLASSPAIPVTVTTLLLIFLASAILFLLMPYLGYLIWRFWRGLDDLKRKDRFAIKNDFIKTAAQILGGAFFLFGLYFTWQNLILTQEKYRADSFIAQEKQTTDLFTKAIEQLGSDKLEVRLGGIYALERIARDSEKDHWPIMEVLTAYVRENAAWPPETLEEAKKKRPWAKARFRIPSLSKEMNTADQKNVKPDPDIQAILTIIGRRARTFRKGENQRLDLRNTDLRGADLQGAHLEGANLSEAHMERTNLCEAHLEKANLLSAHLEWSELREAGLEGAFLGATYLHFANLQEADLRMVEGLKVEQVRPARNWVLSYLPTDISEKLGLPPDHNQRLAKKKLSNYNLSGMDLRGANFLKINLQLANISGANLSTAVFISSNLSNANLANANLEAWFYDTFLYDVKGLTREQLSVAVMDEETRKTLPDYLREPQPEKPEPK